MQLYLLPCRRPFRSIIAIFLFLAGAAASGSAAEQADGAVLYQKHCVGCHGDGSKLHLHVSLLHSLRIPPVGMPVFGEEKLSAGEAWAIGEYLRPGSQPPLEEGPQPKAEASAEPKERAKGPERPAQPAPPKTGSSFKEKRNWLKGFGTSGLD